MYSGSLFIFAYFVHIFVWRTRLPKNPIKTLLLIFFISPLMVIIGGIVLSESSSFFDFLQNINIFGYAHIVLLYICLALTYCLFYQGVSEISPTCVMLLMLNRAGSKGLEIDDFYHMFDDDKTLTPRIRYLAENKLAYIEKDKYCLAPRGNLYVNIAKFQRKVLGFNLISG